MRKLSFPLRRVFIALPLEGEAREHFRAAQELLVGYEDIVRFQNPDTAHLTLYFWHELMEIECDDIIRKVQRIAERCTPFFLHVRGIEVIRDSRTKLPTMLWANIDRSEDLAVLKKLCPWPNIQPFRPHITIARMRKPHDAIIHEKKILKALRGVSFVIPVNCIRLYAEYSGILQTPICDFPLSYSSTLEGSDRFAA